MTGRASYKMWAHAASIALAVVASAHRAEIAAPARGTREIFHRFVRFRWKISPIALSTALANGAFRSFNGFEHNFG
jgi:hypothetical protein